MKKKILLIITILLLTSACSSSYLKNINLKKLNEKLDNKETFVLYLTNEDETGITLKNTLLEVAKENDLKTFYLNTKDLNENDLKELKENFTFEEENIIVFVKKGQETTVLSRITDPYTSKKDLKEELKLQGYLK